MDIKPNPFSLYDFLGYFTPGALTIYGGILVRAHIEGPLTLENAPEAISISKSELYVPFILSAYLLGHFLSFLSSVTVERYAIWSHGYPSRFLLNLPVNGFWEVEKKQERAVRFFLGIVLFPIPLFGHTVGRLLCLRTLFAKPLDERLSSLLREKVKGLIIHNGQIKKPEKYTLEEDHDFFRYVYHFSVENSSNHLPKMQNYVALYGFIRTVCFVFIIGSWFVTCHLVDHLLHASNGEYVSIAPLFWMSASLMAICYVAYMGFMKFYRRFSLEALMAMAVIYLGEPIPTFKSPLGMLRVLFHLNVNGRTKNKRATWPLFLLFTSRMESFTNPPPPPPA